MHPGGSKRIMLAAGGSVDAFWASYPQHQKQDVEDMLAPYKIGNLVRQDDIGDTVNVVA